MVCKKIILSKDGLIFDKQQFIVVTIFSVCQKSCCVHYPNWGIPESRTNGQMDDELRKSANQLIMYAKEKYL